MSTNSLSLGNLDSVTVPGYLSTHLLASDDHLTPMWALGSTHASGSNVTYFSMIHVQVLSKLPKPDTLEKDYGLFNRK